MIGQTVAHYRITAAIGAGGMGQVYRATDTKLHREVALKVLPPEMARSSELLERFQREARAVAALNHPHVVTLYSVEEADGVHFITMELVEGEPLNKLIPAFGMAVQRLVEIAAGLAEALSAAHARGIVHRDLKPANAMLTKEGRVKVLDFGLAKMVESVEGPRRDLPTERLMTREGTVMGTMPYMSPEQLEGRTLDHRSDIFSLGVMLYEMASGERPFDGESSIALASAILRDTPKPLMERRRDLPEGLIPIITRCLEKSAANRFASARDIVNALAGVTRSDSSAAPTMANATLGREGFGVAVMSFKFSGAGSELAGLAAGLTEDIVTGFSRFTYLRVRSQGNELGARYVMEGTLRQAGTKVRFAVQLVDTESKARIWAETYERPFHADGVFELQDDLVHRIVGTCADHFGVLARSISDAVRGRDPSQLGPYEALMRGFGYHLRLTESEHGAAREVLEQAVERAPSNADCWAMLSWVTSHEFSHGFNARPDSLDRALVAARRAVDLAPSSPLAQQALAVVSFYRKERAACLSAAERAIALNPLDTSNEAMFLICFCGEWDRGCALIRRAMELNPHHPRWFELTLAINEYRLSNYRAVVDEVTRANAPEMFWSNVALAAAHGQLGELTAAGNALRELLVQKKDFPAMCKELLGKWFDPQLTVHWMEGLRKAGLKVVPDSVAVSIAADSSKTSEPVSGAVRADEGFWVAVLPFKYSGSNGEITALAEGLTEDIVTGLSRFSYLRVIARSSIAQHSSESGDLRAVGKTLGARYVMEGSLRQAGARLRLAVQLVDANSGAHLWAENFERAFSPETLFELQDDLVPRIVSTVADMYGVLPRSMSASLRGKPDEELTPHEAVLCAFGYMERVTPEEHARVRRILERAVSTAPNQSNCWAMLANLYWEEHAHELNPKPDSLGRALAAARNAVEAAPSNNLAYYALACTLFFQRELLGFRAAAERALELNPMDASVAALIGNLIAYAGDWERGCAVVESAMQLNPRHPGWYWFANFNNAYRQRDYQGALGFALKINLPGNFFTHAVTAAAYGQLGMREAAQKTIRELLAIRPDFAEAAREEFERWNDPEFVEHILDGLRKAGLDVPSEEKGRTSVSGNSESSPISGAVRADEGFWVAVLPFKYSGANAEITALVEGLTEDIVTGLSRFSYLRVIARSSTVRYASEAVDVRSAGRELGARYVMEGSLRQAGTKLRLAVQLVDAVSGAHLWAENYERAFSADSVFEIQDELVPRIVSTVADTNGILVQSMSDAVRSRDPEQLTPYEAVLRSFGYGQRVTPEELAAARFALEVAVRKAPAHADAWAALAWLNVQDYAQGFNLEADSLARGLTAAQRAVDVAPSNHFAWFGLAQALFFHKEFQSFRNAADRAVALNPMDGNSIAFMGELLNYAGDWDRGLALAARAKQLNPHYPGWYWYADFYDAYRRGDDRGALGFALRINLPGQWFSHAAMAAAYGQLGEVDAACKAVRDLLKLQPDFGTVATKVLEKWWQPEYIQRMIDGWRKAGLEIAGEKSSAALAPREAASAQVSIAVLPFSDMSAAKDQEYLCEGMAEEIMNALVPIAGIRVASRTSAIRAAKAGNDLGAIARVLSVGHVLEGSVRSAGTRLRVTAQLTDAASGYQLWSQRFDREAIDVFAIQDEIAAGVVGAVKAHLAPGTRTVQVRPQTLNLDAYRSYLKGRHLRGIEDFGGAMSAFEEAVRLDPAHAPSWTALAEITVLSAHMGVIMPRSALTSAKKALGVARELQGESAEGLHVEAFAAFLERRWEAMESLWRRAIELQPDHVLALGSFAITLCSRQRLDEALPLFERARQADPLASFPYTLAGWGLLMSGKLDDGLRQIEDALSFEKEDASAIGALCIANVALGRLEQAVDAGERGVAVTRGAPFFLGIQGWALATAGRDSEARGVLEELRARPPGSPTAVSEAWLLGALGEIDDAFDVLARAEEEHQGLLSYTGLPGFDSLRSDHRFTALRQRLGLSPE